MGNQAQACAQKCCEASGGAENELAPVHNSHMMNHNAPSNGPALAFAEEPLSREDHVVARDPADLTWLDTHYVAPVSGSDNFTLRDRDEPLPSPPAPELAPEPVSRDEQDEERNKDAGTVAEGAGNVSHYFFREMQELLNLPSESIESIQRKGPHRFATGAVYTGDWLGNQRHGYGRQTWQDGAIFEGEWQENRAEGKGRFVHQDADTYAGEWRNNQAHGIGVYYHQNLTIYKGRWRNDLQHGHGVEQWSEGATYEGEFRDGQKEGSGTYRWPDGSEYCGDWHCNSIGGAGCYTGEDGRLFSGGWRDSMIHGVGNYGWKDGRGYSGQYAEDKKTRLWFLPMARRPRVCRLLEGWAAAWPWGI